MIALTKFICYTQAMEFKDLIYQRQSTRKFKTDPLPMKDLELCIEAARMSPSAVNSQPYNLYVTTGESARRISKARGPYNSFIDNCPAFVIFTERKANIASRLGAKFTDLDFQAMDTGIAVMSLCYQAEELRIGTCILGLFKEKEVQEILGTKDKVCLIVAMGYPEDGYPLRTKKRRNLEEFVEYLD
ncbi:MAG: nitroreductase family protein [Tissierellia bacterium]|nr:nitroreductase family protein [Tissierellia bacterium]